ncbi:MAG: alternative ribosome rescue aminoacyl-tRNA hydrolase ArfB [Candidatus Brocadiia bacterium]
MAERKAIRIGRGASIPTSELDFRFTRSGGPGGQHVNTSATQVELTFDVAGSPSLTEGQKRRIRSALRTYISKQGVMRLTCQTSRSQHRNREECIRRFRALLRGALRPRKRRKPTRPSRAANERRLAEKKRRSELKRQRRFRPPLDA